MLAGTWGKPATGPSSVMRETARGSQPEGVDFVTKAPTTPSEAGYPVSDECAQGKRGRMTEVDALIGKARQSLGAARTLLRDGYTDFAASRAYYAMFYVAEALLLARGLSYTKHSAVISAFGREFAKAGHLDARRTADRPHPPVQ